MLAWNFDFFYFIFFSLLYFCVLLCVFSGYEPGSLIKLTLSWISYIVLRYKYGLQP